MAVDTLNAGIEHYSTFTAPLEAITWHEKWMKFYYDVIGRDCLCLLDQGGTCVTYAYKGQGKGPGG